MERPHVSYLVLDVVPGPAAKHVADGELEQIEGHEGDEAVEPDHAGPTPPDGLDLGEPEVAVHGNGGGDLKPRQGSQDQHPLVLCSGRWEPRRPAGEHTI